MSKKLGVLLIVLLLASMLLPACSSKPAPKGNITLWHSWKESEIPALNEVIAAFQAEYPEVTFDVLYVPFDDLRGKYETAVATGGGPTVLIGAADWGPSLYDAELVADVSDLAKSSFLKTINEAALGAVQYKDALIGLPQTIKGVVLFRNKKILPKAVATSDELLKLHAEAPVGNMCNTNLEAGFFFSAAHLDGMGGKLMEANGDPAFSNAKGVEWVKLLDSFAKTGLCEYYTDNDVNLFKAGNAGLIIDGSWNMTGLAEAIGAENLVVDPWPKHGSSGHLSGYVQTENIYLSANAQGDAETAGWAFMEFFLSKESQTTLTKAGHIPATLGVSVSDPLMQQVAKAFELGTAFPVIPEMGAYWESMDNALKSVIYENADPAAALKIAHDSITAKIKEIRAGQ